MRKIKQMLVLIAWMVLLNSCSKVRSNMESNTQRDVMKWFDSSDWKSGLEIDPDSTINPTKLHKQYHLNPKLWLTAFEFIRTQNLSSLDVGRYDLITDSLFVIIDEYNTKDEASTRYESHREYADIQYLISGQERIGVNDLDMSTIVQPYNTEKDIAFYDMPTDNYRLADQDKFFIFFPTDAHRPCVKVSQNDPVRKIVIKVKVTGFSFD